MKCKSTPYQGMDKRFAYLGEWWLPDQPGKKFRGILTYEPHQNVSLKLFGTGKELASSFEGYWKQETLLGVSSSGEQITVRECYIGQSSTSQSPKGTKSCVVLGPAWVFIGAHFVSDEEIRFDSVKIQYPYLAYWLKFPPRNPDSGDSANYDAENEGSDFHTIALDNFATLSIELAPDLQRWPSSGTSDYTLRESAYVRFEFAGRTSLEMIWTRYKRQWEHFFSLAMGRPAYALDVRGVLSSGNREEVAILQGIGYRPNFYEMFPFVEMLFSYADIKCHFDSYLCNWYSNVKDLEYVCDMYFAVVYQPDLYLEHKFLTYVIALEAYHRVATQKEYDKLAKALAEVLKSVSAVSSTFIGLDAKTQEKFLRQVKEARNALVHYGACHKAGEVLTAEQLSVMTLQLQMLVQSCLLLSMGLSDAQICEFITNTGLGKMLKEKLQGNKL